MTSALAALKCVTKLGSCVVTRAARLWQEWLTHFSKPTHDLPNGKEHHLTLCLGIHLRKCKMTLADDDISRWVDKVEEVTRNSQFLSIAMPPMSEKRIQPPRRVKKHPRDDPSIEEMAECETPPKKQPASASKAASRASCSMVEDLLLLESAGITPETLDPARLPEDSHPLYSSIS